MPHSAHSVWRGAVWCAGCVPNLQRILSGLLHFLWGQHGVKHIDHWMESAHTQIILLALRNVQQRWLPPEVSVAAGTRASSPGARRGCSQHARVQVLPRT